METLKIIRFELKRLAEEITARLPRIEITDLLVEVDSWTDFSNALEHLNLAQNQDSSSLLSLYSCLLAQACNLDFQQMATSTGLLYRLLMKPIGADLSDN